MKISTALLATLLCLVLSEHQIHAQLSMSGTYQGKNIYVQNPMSDDNSGYCTDSVLVNGTNYNCAISDGAYEIKLDTLGLALGDSVSIRIFHKQECKPKVLNNYCFIAPEISLIKDIELAPNGKLSWKATPASTHTFLVEQYKWNRWVEVSRLNAEEMDSLGAYSALCTFLHGENTFRVQLLEGKKSVHVSREISLQSAIKKVDCTYKKDTKTVIFSSVTTYELYTNTGDRIKQGASNLIDLSELEKGIYYLNYDVSQLKIRLR